MLTRELVTAASPTLKHIEAIVQEAFPENERMPIAPLADDPSGICRVTAFFDGSLFCGFSCTVTLGNIVYLMYLAIEDQQRGQGYGTQLLGELRNIYPRHSIAADVESDIPSAPNRQQRWLRKKFYLKNGYTESQARFHWRGESYQFLINGPMISPQELWSFWNRVTQISPPLAGY